MLPPRSGLHLFWNPALCVAGADHGEFGLPPCRGQEKGQLTGREAACSLPSACSVRWFSAVPVTPTSLAVRVDRTDVLRAVQVGAQQGSGWARRRGRQGCLPSALLLLRLLQAALFPSSSPSSIFSSGFGPEPCRAALSRALFRLPPPLVRTPVIATGRQDNSRPSPGLQGSGRGARIPQAPAPPRFPPAMKPSASWE